MKKILALLVSLTLALSVCAFTTITASAETKYYEEKVFIADDFENYGTGAMSSFKGQAGVDAAVGAEVVYDSAKGSNVLKAKGKRYCVMFAGQAALNSAETIVMQFDFMAPANPVASGNPAGALISLENVSEEGAGWLADGGDGLRAPNTTSFTGTDYFNKWYTARAYHDVATGKTEWYAGPLGGELTYKGTQTTNIADKSKIGRIDIYNPSEIYVDNIRVYEGKPADGLTSLLLKAKASKKTAEVAINPALVTYPDGAVAELGRAITEAENALASATTTAEVNAITATFNTAYQNFLKQGTDKQMQTVVFETDFSPESSFGSTYLVLNDVQKTVEGDRNAIRLTGSGTSYARFINDLASHSYYDKYVMKASFRQDVKAPVHQVVSLFSNGANGENTIAEIYSDGTNLCARYCDESAGCAGPSSAKNAVIVENYSADVWYDFEIAFDYTDRTFTVMVNGEPKLTDRILYFVGKSVSKAGLMRAGVYALPTQQLYVSEFSLYADESASLIDAYNTIGAEIPVGTGAEYMRELPTVIGDYEVSYESEDFDVVQDKVFGKLIAYSVFTDEDYEGVLVAKINVDGTDYRFSYKLPVKAAYTGTVIDHNFDVEAGTAVNAIDPAYWTAEGAIASVAENGAISLNGQRTLYSVPDAKKAAGISVVSLKFMAPEAEISDQGGHIISISGEDGKSAIEVCLNDGNICISPGDYFDATEFPGGYATMKAPIVTDYEAGKWYDIKVLINFDSRSYKVTVDGQTTLNNRAITIAEPIRNIGRISMRASSGKQIYIDDLKIYTTDFASVKGIDNITIKQNEREEVSKVIYPSSYDSEGEMIADNYTFEIAGENTYGIRVSKTGAVAVTPVAKAGVYKITATSVYNPEMSVTTTVTVIGTDYAVTEFSITSGGNAVETLENGMTLTAKAVLTKNSDNVKDDEINLVIAHYDENGKLVAVKKSVADFTKKQSGAAVTTTCDLTLEGEDFTNHTVRAFLVYKKIVYPVTGSIGA